MRERSKKWRASGSLLLLLTIAAALVLFAGCAQQPVSSSSTSPAGKLGSFADGSKAFSDDALVRLEVLYSQISYYQQAWPGYHSLLFALYPSGRLLVRDPETSGYGNPARFIEATVSNESAEQIMAWVRDAKVHSLSPEYPTQDPRAKTHMMITDLPGWRLTVRDEPGNVGAQVKFEPGYPVSEYYYPAGLKALVEKLLSFRPEAGRAFVPERIEVVALERAKMTGDHPPLPNVLSLTGMSVVSRSVEEVKYQKTVSGIEAREIVRFLDAGQYVYSGSNRSYLVFYRPLDPALGYQPSTVD